MNEDSLRVHKQICQVPEEEKTVFKCELCKYSSTAIKYLKAHVMKVHEKEKHKLQCDDCGKTFMFQSELKIHREMTHEGIKRKPYVKSKSYELMCDKCGKSFQSKKRLHYHTSNNECQAEPIKCEKCNGFFSGRRYYVAHFRSKHGGEPQQYAYNEGEFICDQCPNGYMTKQGLSKHIQSDHLGIKEVRKFTLKKCKDCNKAFKNLASLKEHILSKHENITPYQCGQCHRSYGTKVRLGTHIQNMHQRVKCDECNQEICNNFMLKRHKASVHNSKPDNVFQCEYCPQFYYYEVALEKHITKHHLQLP